ncbi:MAG: glycosyltransferase [bacterium]|nr:glycosyltransferase [bacterium]
MNSVQGPTPLVSVIIPHLNQPEFLQACLVSLASQDFTRDGLEIIVVDNGSSEMPTDVCAAYANVRLTSEATAGPGPARNKGVTLARAPLLAFIDADCTADPGWIAAVVAAFADDTTDVIGGDVRIAVVNPARLTAIEAYESVFAYRQREYIEKHGFSGTGNLAMRRTAYDAVGPFGGIDIAEDRDWGKRASSAGCTIRYVPSMKVFHPARRSIDELTIKWDRHIAHEMEERRTRPITSILRAGAVGLSPIADCNRVILSDRILTIRDRVQAIAVLFRIRTYRAGRMLMFLDAGRRSETSAAWNR